MEEREQSVWCGSFGSHSDSLTQDEFVELLSLEQYSSYKVAPEKVIPGLKQAVVEVKQEVKKMSAFMQVAKTLTLDQLKCLKLPKVTQ